METTCSDVKTIEVTFALICDLQIKLNYPLLKTYMVYIIQMKQAQHRAVTETTAFIGVFHYNDQCSFHLENDFLDEFETLGSRYACAMKLFFFFFFIVFNLMTKPKSEQ